MQLAYDEMDLVTARDEVKHRAQAIRSIVLLEGSREPRAAVAATDVWPARVDRAAAFGSLVQAGTPPQLGELVDS